MKEKLLLLNYLTEHQNISCGNILLQKNCRSYLDALYQMVKNYHEKVHSTIKMAPIEASKDITQGKVYFNIIRKQNKSRASIKYKKGDKVRISKYKRHFEKGYTPNWTEEIFTIDKINMTNPVTYQVRDLNNKRILALFTHRSFPQRSKIYLELKR